MKKQIEELGRVLGNVLGALLGMKQKGDVTRSIDFTAEALKSDADLDLYHLLSLSPEEMLHFLIHDKKFRPQHLEILADIFAELPEQELRASLLYRYAQLNSDTFSVALQYKITSVENKQE
ncbi:MAG: hypothetical protein ACKOXB_14690 [Flavobacteriales bacterium]